MYTLLQSRLDSLLFEIVFPLMCFNDNDQKLWDEDPHEYVRKGYGMAFWSEFISLKTLDWFRQFRTSLGLLQISLKIYTVRGLLPWILLVSWLESVEKKIFTSLFNLLWEFLRGTYCIYVCMYVRTFVSIFLSYGLQCVYHIMGALMVLFLFLVSFSLPVMMKHQ